MNHRQKNELQNINLVSKKGHSTDTSNNKSNNRTRYCTLFTDVRQIFNKVWHVSLLETIAIFFFFEFRTKVHKEVSKNLIKSGVPQKSILGTILYKIYVLSATDIATSEQFWPHKAIQQ